MASRDGRRGAVFGFSGSGKSAFTLNMVEGVERLFAFDPKGSWLKYPGFEVIKHFAQVRPFLDDIGDGAFRCVYMPEDEREIQRLSTLSNMLMDFQEGFFWETHDRKMTLVVDELSDCAPLSLGGKHTGFLKLCKKGRESGINLIGISQSPAEVHRTFRANLNFCAAFEFSFINDREAVARIMQDQKVQDELMTLKEYEYIFYENRKWAKRQPLKL